MRVEVQYTDNCPNAITLISHLRQRKDIELVLTRVAQNVGVPDDFAGSPTVLIDGTNPFAGGRVDAPACALFPPTVAELEAHLPRR